ncbi:MAG: outer membrane beta-barrel protein [Burkholderiaceae bacterium]|nr:outer membrane beta-barrel protein [Burkholderiaceae bacterium]
MTNFKKCHLALAIAAAAFAGAAHADDSQPANTVRVGAYFVHFDTSANDVSGPFTPPGINLSVDNTTTAYFGYIRHLDSHWSIEVAGGIPPNTKTYGKGPATVGSVPFNGQEVATAKWLSPSVLAEYSFFDPSNAFRPYIGLGFNYTKFYDRKSTAAGDAANGGPTAISLSSSVGPAATLGLQYKINRDWDIAASYSVAEVDSNYTSNTSGIQRSTTIHFAPHAAVVAVGYSF